MSLRFTLQKHPFAFSEYFCRGQAELLAVLPFGLTPAAALGHGSCRGITSRRHKAELLYSELMHTGIIFAMYQLSSSDVCLPTCHAYHFLPFSASKHQSARLNTRLSEAETTRVTGEEKL